MRIAALAFGVLAGLAASLILALGGLDPAALPQLDPRQMSLISFFLFVIAGFGVFGAGIVLAAPLAGAILLALGAIGWIGAALLLHHGPDFVMLTPPGLLLVATILAGVAVVRGRHPAAAHVSADEDGEAEDDEARFERERELALGPIPPQAHHADEEADAPVGDAPVGVAVGASFFGDAGTATPLLGTIGGQVAEEVRQPGRSEEPAADLGPIRRRSDPPRQKSVFVEPEDEYEDEESGFSRFARGFSSVLSFGLYAALAGAAVLIFWNLRTGDATRPTATRIEASASSATAAPVLAPSSSAAPARIAETPRVSALPSLLAPPAAPLLAGEPAPSSTFGTPSSAVDRELSSALSSPALSSAADSASIAPPEDPFAAASSIEQSAPEPAASAEPLAPPVQTASASAPLPFAMPPQMAAARARPAPRPTPPAPTATTDTGL